ncbi:MAG: hypothetical protein M1816_007497 [Peltula sp. TS41687]|nr:MAG: hypothetical protein M1816_007497 [Peltula sp. TS41687]
MSSTLTMTSTFISSSPVGGLAPWQDREIHRNSNLFRRFVCGHTALKFSGNRNPFELGRQIPISGADAENPFQACRSCHWRMMFMTEQRLIKDVAERRAELRLGYGEAYVATFDQLGTDDLGAWTGQWVDDTVSKLVYIQYRLWRQVRTNYRVWAEKWGPQTEEEMMAWSDWISGETEAEARDREEMTGDLRVL